MKTLFEHIRFYSAVKPVCLKTSNNTHQTLNSSKLVTPSVHIVTWPLPKHVAIWTACVRNLELLSVWCVLLEVCRQLP
jgi:hypothetical protein